ncbi:MAG: hypothetical protein ACRC8S_08740 [Fimbriiglobus sp.]
MDQIDLIKHVVDILESLNVPYALVGSWGSGVYGEPRFTRDVDIVIDLPAFLIPRFCAQFPGPEFYLNSDSVVEAVRDRFQFNLLHPASGNKIDFIMTREESWKTDQLARRRIVKLGINGGSFPVYFSAPEDVILGKLWYHAEGGGERHLRDIAGILRTSQNRVDRSLIERWVKKLGYDAAWSSIIGMVDDQNSSRDPAAQ